MKRVTKKLQTFINSISVIGDSRIEGDHGKIYYSKIDGSYLARVGLENELSYLLKAGVTEQIQESGVDDGLSCSACIGFNPKEQKWFGWSHRAIFGFGIGSECKKGMCQYEPDTKESFTEGCLRFWGDTDMEGDTHKVNPTAEETTRNGKLGVYVSYTYDDKTPNKSMRGQIDGVFSEYPDRWGKGEWKAKTLEEAKIMALDFAKGVS